MSTDPKTFTGLATSFQSLDEVWRGFDDGPPPPAKEAELLAFFANPAEVSPETLEEPVTAGGGEWRVDRYGTRFLATRADCRFIDGITERWEYLREHAKEAAALKKAQRRAEAEREEAERRWRAERHAKEQAARREAELRAAARAAERAKKREAAARAAMVQRSVERSRARRWARRRIARPA